MEKMVNLEDIKKKMTIQDKIDSIVKGEPDIFACMDDSSLVKYSYDWFFEFFTKKGYSIEKSKILALKFCKKD